MNINRILRLPLLVLGLQMAGNAAVVMTENYTFSSAPLPLAPPDGTGIPVSDTRTISSSQIASITDLNVKFTLTNPAQAGAFNGDYYVSLQHESGFSVLLNRVGRRLGTSVGPTRGYGDNGFSVTFDDQAGNGDIHGYRVTLSGGSHTVPVDANFNQPLTGIWAPDGRTTSPLTVLNTDPRTASLSVFNGLTVNGAWILQVIDFSGGGTASLSSWELSLVGEAVVPEPSNVLAFTGVTLLTLALLRKKLSNKSVGRDS
jgi:hypothetical protein